MVVGVIGPGRVGKALLEQVRSAAPILLERRRLDIRIVGIAASRVMRIWDSNTGDVETAPQQITDLETFVAHLRSQGESPVIVDCTASPELANHYAAWLRRGIHVVTPNKHAGSGPLERWRSIGEAAIASGSRYLHEATVCAGLPVIQTLKGLLSTGDDLISVHGIFSGTLAWIFHQTDARQAGTARCCVPAECGNLPLAALAAEVVEWHESNSHGGENQGGFRAQPFRCSSLTVASVESAGRVHGGHVHGDTLGQFLGTALERHQHADATASSITTWAW